MHSSGFGPTFKWYIGQHYRTHPNHTYQLQVGIYRNYEHCRTQHYPHPHNVLIANFLLFPLSWTTALSTKWKASIHRLLSPPLSLSLPFSNARSPAHPRNLPWQASSEEQKALLAKALSLHVYSGFGASQKTKPYRTETAVFPKTKPKQTNLGQRETVTTLAASNPCCIWQCQSYLFLCSPLLRCPRTPASKILLTHPLFDIVYAQTISAWPPVPCSWCLLLRGCGRCHHFYSCPST